jgi:death-on-curing protein
MKTIYFLNLDEVVKLHDLLILKFGGHSGIRDIGLLDSALHQPKVKFGNKYLCNDIFEMSAAYMFHIIKNHPFIDGNKRTGIFTAINFLEFNYCEINFDLESFYQLTIDVANSKINKKEITNFFKKNVLES